jgi:non-heme Fe2+,alpha-ketoglutarate-dependent halogenase
MSVASRGFGFDCTGREFIVPGTDYLQYSYFIDFGGWGLMQQKTITRQLFERDGYVAPLSILSEGEVARYRNTYDQLEADRKAKGITARPTQQHFVYKPFWDLATHPRVLEIMRTAVGDDLVLIATGFFAKSPNDSEKYVAWHQDTTYWGLQPPFAATLWIAIDDSDIENGCLRVIPGSHRKLLPHGTSARTGNILGNNQEIDPEFIDESRAVDLELKAGQASLHHGLSVHGSNPNRSQRRRCGMTVRFTRPDVKPVAGVFVDKPILVSGEDRYGNFTYLPRPQFAEPATA